MAEVTSYIKFFGAKGTVTFRGESGWTVWTSLSVNDGRLSSGSRGTNLLPMTFLCSRDHVEGDAALVHLFGARNDAKQISVVEIVAMRSIAGKTGPNGELAFHLIVKNVSINIVLFDPDFVEFEAAKEDVVWKYPATGGK